MLWFIMECSLGWSKPYALIELSNNNNKTFFCYVCFQNNKVPKIASSFNETLSVTQSWDPIKHKKNIIKVFIVKHYYEVG